MTLPLHRGVAAIGSGRNRCQVRVVTVSKVLHLLTVLSHSLFSVPSSHYVLGWIKLSLGQMQSMLRVTVGFFLIAYGGAEITGLK